MQTFDTHEYIKELQNADVPLEQAEAHSNALKRVFDLDELSTKRDLAELETRLDTKMDHLEIGLNTKMDHLEVRLNTMNQQLESRLNTKIDELEIKIKETIISLIKWLIPMLLGQTGLIFLLMKFFNSSSAG